MEKFSSIERVVGNVPETKKEEILRDMGERFDDQSFEELKGKERKKTREEMQIIGLANEETNELRRKYRLDDFDIPPKNIHVIDRKAWPEVKAAAVFQPKLQAVAMREKMSNTSFAKTVFHEMLHFKSYNVLQVLSGENSELEQYRLGLFVVARNGKAEYFVNLNEAVTEEMAKRFIKKLLNNPLFAAETRQTKDIARQYPRTVLDSGKPLFDVCENRGRKIMERVSRTFIQRQITWF